MDYKNRMYSLKEGYSIVTYQEKNYGVIKTVFNNGKSIKIFAKCLERNDMVSLNFYHTSAKDYLKPCEMPAEKVIHFLEHMQL